MKVPTEKQMEILRLWNPWGQNMKLKEISKELSIKYKTVLKRISIFKNNFPEGYKKIKEEKLRLTYEANKSRNRLRSPISLSGVRLDIISHEIKQKF